MTNRVDHPTIKNKDTGIKIIEDLNNNGLWDNGDLESMLYPERTFISNQLINVRAYWDIEQSININDIISQQ